MRELPGDVFVTGQLLPAQMQALAEQGVMTFLNNRPDMEAPLQPRSEDLEALASKLGVDYHYIPMSGAITPGILEASATAFSEMPRPVVAFCASGTRSAALWAFSHVKDLGVDGVMTAMAKAGYPLEQIRPALQNHLGDH